MTTEVIEVLDGQTSPLNAPHLFPAEADIVGITLKCHNNFLYAYGSQVSDLRRGFAILTSQGQQLQARKLAAKLAQPASM